MSSEIKSFGSDNFSGVHSLIMNYLQEINSGHEESYGADKYTELAEKKFKELFGKESEVYFVFNGTAANVLCIQAAAKSFNSVICSDVAHIYVDECGAVEKFTGCQIIPVHTNDGKLNPEMIKPCISGTGDEHRTQPRVVSITQPTEMGALYQPDEIKAITDFAHKNDMVVHMDGARICNAAAALESDFKTFTKDAGLDLLSFGGTKNGMMFGEAVVILNNELAKDFKYMRKQSMQLGSKMRFISGQFLALLRDNLWYINAKHSNDMAKMLENELINLPSIKISQKVEANAVFTLLPEYVIKNLPHSFNYNIIDPQIGLVRWMCTFDTTTRDIHDIVETIKQFI